jgi:hypothetical protein
LRVVTSREQKRALVELELRHDPARSNRSLARLFGVSHNTVASVRVLLEHGGQIDHLAEQCGVRTGFRTAPPVGQSLGRGSGSDAWFP